VRDPQGVAVSDAAITVREKGLQLGSLLRTDAAGRASFAWSFADALSHELSFEVTPPGGGLLAQSESLAVSAGRSAALEITCQRAVAAPQVNASPAAAVPVAAPAVQYGVARYSSGQFVRFSAPFGSTPVVVTSAQANGRACASAPVSIQRDGFTVLLTSDTGAAVQNAWVQWIAVLADPASGIQAGVLQANNGSGVSFPRMASVPVIVTCAQKGTALFSGAVSNRADGFTLSLLDDAGRAVSGAWVMWLAVVPSARNGFAGRVEQRRDGENVTLSRAFPRGPAYVVSAQPGAVGAAVGNRTDGFTLSLVSHQGTGASGVWTQWLGYAGP
jgi:hypothetical protein